MKYLKKFENHAAYEAAESGLILPNVSLCVQENEVHYKPDLYNGHEYVDLELPNGTKWATMNVGASGETDYGLYFQWGDAQGYTYDQVGIDEGLKYFDWADYKYSNNGGSGATDMTKYQGTGEEKDGLVTLEASDDAVAVAWGGSWRMPTEAEITELLNNTIKQWTTNYNNTGINGCLFISVKNNSKTLFFPAAGSCARGSVGVASYFGGYWSSSLDTSKVTDGKFLSLMSGNYSMGSNYRRNGHPVRGVVAQ